MYTLTLYLVKTANIHVHTKLGYAKSVRKTVRKICVKKKDFPPTGV